MKQKNKIRNTWSLIRISFMMSPANYVVLTMAALISSADSVIQTVIPTILIDMVMGNKPMPEIMWIIVVYAFILLVSGASKQTFSLLSTAFGYTANNKAGLSVGLKGMRIRYCCWENTETYEKIVKAKNNSWVIQSIADMVCENWISSIFTLIPVIYILHYLNVYLLIALFLLIIVELYWERKATEKQYKIELSRTSDEKKLRYDEKVMTELAYGKELRIYNAIECVIQRYEESRKKVLASEMQQKKVSIGFQAGAVAISCIESILLYIFAIPRYQEGMVSISFFLLLISTVRLLTESVKCLMETFVWVSELTDYYGDYKKFMEEPEELTVVSDETNEEMTKCDIEFRNVSFRYPNTEKYAIKNVSFTIPYGKKLAVVGENGAGKSTLVKLLLRFYDVEEGEILLNGKNVNEIDYVTYLRKFSTVFQDYKLHSFSLRENIIFDRKNEDNKLWMLLEQQGIAEAVKNTKNGLDTFLSKQLDEDGQDFSGGEKQRLAMVRAMYKNADYYILDEPTSAIDPLAEFDYFNNLKEVTSEKTAIYVTHRMASTKYADEIIVLDKGCIIEKGDFQQLIDLNGNFKAMFELQAAYYKI